MGQQTPLRRAPLGSVNGSQIGRICVRWIRITQTLPRIAIVVAQGTDATASNPLPKIRSSNSTSARNWPFP